MFEKADVPPFNEDDLVEAMGVLGRTDTGAVALILVPPEESGGPPLIVTFDPNEADRWADQMRSMAKKSRDETIAEAESVLHDTEPAPSNVVPFPTHEVRLRALSVDLEKVIRRHVDRLGPAALRSSNDLIEMMMLHATESFKRKSGRAPTNVETIRLYLEGAETYLSYAVALREAAERLEPEPFPKDL